MTKKKNNLTVELWNGEKFPCDTQKQVVETIQRELPRWMGSDDHFIKWGLNIAYACDKDGIWEDIFAKIIHGPMEPNEKSKEFAYKMPQIEGWYRARIPMGDNPDAFDYFCVHIEESRGVMAFKYSNCRYIEYNL